MQEYNHPSKIECFVGLQKEMERLQYCFSPETQGIITNVVMAVAVHASSCDSFVPDGLIERMREEIEVERVSLA